MVVANAKTATSMQMHPGFLFSRLLILIVHGPRFGNDKLQQRSSSSVAVVVLCFVISFIYASFWVIWPILSPDASIVAD